MQLHSFLHLALDVGQWLTSHTGCFTPGGKTPQYPLNWRLDGPQSWTTHFGEEKNSCPFQESNPRLSSLYPSHYTDYANPSSHLIWYCTSLHEEHYAISRFLSPLLKQQNLSVDIVNDFTDNTMVSIH